VNTRAATVGFWVLSGQPIGLMLIILGHLSGSRPFFLCVRVVQARYWFIGPAARGAPKNARVATYPTCAGSPPSSVTSKG
jgi:hypothetical protein